jgi:L-fuconolactonase
MLLGHISVGAPRPAHLWLLNLPAGRQRLGNASSLDEACGLSYNAIMETPIVDAHLHVWEMPSDRYPWQPLRNMRPAEAGPVEMLLDIMSDNGVAQAVIVQPSNYGYDHRYVAGCLQRFPGRFGGVALVDFRAGEAPQRISELHSLGFRGVRLFLYHEKDLSWVSPVIDPAMQRIADLGMIVTVFGPWHELDRVRRLAHRFPAVRFVIDHLGHPDITESDTWMPILQLAEQPTMYVKVSDFPSLSHQAYPFADVHPFVRRVYESFGAERLMWASNFPQSLRIAPYADLMRLAELALPDLSLTDRQRVMGGTAAALWNLAG